MTSTPKGSGAQQLDKNLTTHETRAKRKKGAVLKPNRHGRGVTESESDLYGGNGKNNEG